MPEGIKTDHPNSANELLRQEFNKLRAKFDAVLAEMDTDSGITGTSWASGHGTGSTNGASDVTLQNG